MPQRPRLLGLAVILTIVAGATSARVSNGTAAVLFALAILVALGAVIQEVQRWRQ